MYALRSELGVLRHTAAAAASTSRSLSAESSRTAAAWGGMSRSRTRPASSKESVQRYTTIFSFFRSLHSSPCSSAPSTPSHSPVSSSALRASTSTNPRATLSSAYISRSRPALPCPAGYGSYYVTRGKKKKARAGAPSWLYDLREWERELELEFEGDGEKGEREGYHSTPPNEPRPARPSGEDGGEEKMAVRVRGGEGGEEGGDGPPAPGSGSATMPERSEERAVHLPPPVAPPPVQASLSFGRPTEQVIPTASSAPSLLRSSDTIPASTIPVTSAGPSSQMTIPQTPSTMYQPAPTATRATPAIPQASSSTTGPAAVAHIPPTQAPYSPASHTPPVSLPRVPPAQPSQLPKPSFSAQSPPVQPGSSGASPEAAQASPTPPRHVPPAEPSQPSQPSSAPPPFKQPASSGASPGAARAPLTPPPHIPPAQPSPPSRPSSAPPTDQPASPGASREAAQVPPPPPSHPLPSPPPQEPPAQPSQPSQSSSAPPTPPDQPASPGAPPEPPKGDPPYLRFYPRHLRRLARSLPYIHIRPPSIDDILKVTTGFWQRLSVRFRWLTIRSFRRFTAEEYGTFLGWFVLSQTVWLLLGTTTFVGAIVLTLNSLRLQHYVAGVISKYLTSETGWDIAYESATVPRWRDATISFKNVYVSQKPKTYTATNEDGTTEERASYMTVNLDIDSIDVTLSLWRWLDGKGLVKNAVVKGVRGVMDRRNVYWDPDKVYNPADFRHQPTPGAFELESLRIEDALVTVYQTRRFRPFFVSIFKAEIGRFRRQWMFYDFISAESIVGQFDNCLFSVHKPQSVSRTRDAAMKEEGWKRLSRLRIDGVSIDHFKATLSSETGLWSWIQSGKVDAVLDIRFPTHPDDDNIDLGQIISNITAELAEQLDRLPGQRELARPALEVPGDLEESETAIAEDLQGDAKQRKVEIDIDLRFRDLKAAVPIFTNELSYVNNALIRPIVAFINANRTLLPIRCRIVKDLSDFDGSWTLWETGLMDDIAAKTYDALAYHVQHGMNRNIKAVSLWSLQMTASAVIAALRNALEHAGDGMFNLQALQSLQAFAI